MRAQRLGRVDGADRSCLDRARREARKPVGLSVPWNPFLLHLFGLRAQPPNQGAGKEDPHRFRAYLPNEGGGNGGPLRAIRGEWWPLRLRRLRACPGPGPGSGVLGKRVVVNQHPIIWIVLAVVALAMLVGIVIPGSDEFVAGVMVLLLVAGALWYRYFW